MMPNYENIVGVWIQSPVPLDDTPQMTAVIMEKGPDHDFVFTLKINGDEPDECTFSITHDSIIIEVDGVRAKGKYNKNGDIEWNNADKDSKYFTTWRKPCIDDFTGTWFQSSSNHGNPVRLKCRKISTKELKCTYENSEDTKERTFQIRTLGPTFPSIVDIDNPNVVGLYKGDGNITFYKNSEYHMTWKGI